MLSTAESYHAMIERRVSLPGILAEIRTYQWEAEGAVTKRSPYYCFTQMLGPNMGPNVGMDRVEPMAWKLPGSLRFLRFGRFGVVPPDTEIEVRRTPSKVSTLVVMVEPEMFHDITGLEEGWYNERLMFRLNREYLSLTKTLNEVASEMIAPGHGSAILIEGLCRTFLVRFARQVNASREPHMASGLSEWQLSKVRELAATEPANRLTVDRLAAACGVSGRHLMRGFKAVTGETVHGYIDQVRHDRTKALLRTSQLPLKVIAADVGYASASHLSSAFSAAEGMSPSEYRQRFKNNLNAPPIV